MFWIRCYRSRAEVGSDRHKNTRPLKACFGRLLAASHGCGMLTDTKDSPGLALLVVCYPFLLRAGEEVLAGRVAT